MNFYKMKQKISVTIDENTLNLLDEIMKEGLFRNKSHIIEFSLNKFIRELKNEEKLWCS